MAFMTCFLWTESSAKRNLLTAKYEPIQPFLFVGFLEYAHVQVVLDIGANVGAYTLMATLVDSVASVYAFEPDETAFKELQKNVLLNGLEQRVWPSALAVSDREGEVHFGSHEPMSGINGVLGSTIHNPELFKNVRDVRSISLDHFSDFKGKTLGIKIDVEGHELNVIKGALKLLKDCPSVIQVEHYVGSQIDDELEKLGYFRFFTAGHDHYFTNISNFANPVFLKQAVEYATACLVESQSGRWGGGKTIKGSLSISCSVDGDVINAKAKCDERFFSHDVEYAFYLMENGTKVDEQWYKPESSVQFPFNPDAESVEVRGFVRERKMPSKKVVVGEYVKRPAVGYRAPSAVEDSRDLPSRYASLSRRYAAQNFPYSMLDISSLVSAINKLKPSHIIQLGADSGVSDVLAQLHSNGGGHLTLVCAEGHCGNVVELTGVEEHHYLKLFEISGLEELPGRLLAPMKGQEEPALLVLRSQFLADIGRRSDSLVTLFKMMRRGSVVFTDAYSNETHRQELTDLADEYGLSIQLLYPQSTIISSELLSGGSRIRDMSEAETRKIYESFIQACHPDSILHFGDCPSALILAQALKAANAGQLYCMAESSESLDELRSAIREGGLEAVITPLFAPLEEWAYHYPEGCRSELKRWFDESILEQLPPLDWVVVDGPDWQGQPCTRYPALPSVLEQLAPGAEVWMLGARDSRVQQVVDAWRKDYGFDATAPDEAGVVRLSR